MKGSELKAKLKNEGINLSELSRKLGYDTDQNLHSVLGAADVKSSLIERISLVLGRPINWFYDDDATEEKSDINAGIPLIPLEAIAGPGTSVYEDEKEFEYYSVPAFRDSDFLIRVKGDSMTPKFTGGDLVACKKLDIKSVYFIQWNRVYVVYTKSQGVMIKRIQPSENEDCIKCVSDNEKYAPFDVPKSDIVSLALVNGKISFE